MRRIRADDGNAFCVSGVGVGDCGGQIGNVRNLGADCASWGGCVFGLVGKGEVLGGIQHRCGVLSFQGDGLGNGNVFCPATALRVAGAVFIGIAVVQRPVQRDVFRISMNFVCNAVVRVGNGPHHLLHLRGRDTIGKGDFQGAAGVGGDSANFRSVDFDLAVFKGDVAAHAKLIRRICPATALHLHECPAPVAGVGLEGLELRVVGYGVGADSGCRVACLVFLGAEVGQRRRVIHRGDSHGNAAGAFLRAACALRVVGAFRVSVAVIDGVADGDAGRRGVAVVFVGNGLQNAVDVGVGGAGVEGDGHCAVCVRYRANDGVADQNFVAANGN